MRKLLVRIFKKVHLRTRLRLHSNFVVEEMCVNLRENKCNPAKKRKRTNPTHRWTAPIWWKKFQSRLKLEFILDVLMFFRTDDPKVLREGAKEQYATPNSIVFIRSGLDRQTRGVLLADGDEASVLATSTNFVPTGTNWTIFWTTQKCESGAIFKTPTRLILWQIFLICQVR